MQRSSSRIQQLFSTRKAHIAYLTAGDGGKERTLSAALALIAGGINMLEIGIPFSDPVADGPIIQRAANRSLARGTHLDDVLWLIESIRQKSDIPLILFSYLNPILAGGEHFLKSAKLAGIDGLLIVDCPFEESASLRQQCNSNAIDLIYIIAPTTSEKRLKLMLPHARGFLYYACRKGTTGVQNGLPDDFAKQFQMLKREVHLPVVVGFGISNAKMVADVLTHAEGAVIGSLFVQALEEGADPTMLTTLAHSLFSNNFNGDDFYLSSN